VRISSTGTPQSLSNTAPLAEEKDEDGEADHLADALADEFLSSLSGYENEEDVEVLTEQLMAQLGVSKEEMLQARQKEEEEEEAAAAEAAGETAETRNVKEKGGAQGQRPAGGKGKSAQDMEAQMAAMLEQLAAVAEKSKKESSGDAASGETAADGAGDREAEALLNSLLSGLGDEDGLLGGGDGDDSDDGDSGEEGDGERTDCLFLTSLTLFHFPSPTLPTISLSRTVDILATMLDAVFSKEMLYPSLSELRDRYPPWLAEQGDALSPADQQRFKAQHSNITAICRLYEASDRPDSKAVLDLINRVGRARHCLACTSDATESIPTRVSPVTKPTIPAFTDEQPGITSGAHCKKYGHRVGSRRHTPASQPRRRPVQPHVSAFIKLKLRWQAGDKRPHRLIQSESFFGSFNCNICQFCIVRSVSRDASSIRSKLSKLSDSLNPRKRQQS
jgi:hypothetical protein